MRARSLVLLLFALCSTGALAQDEPAVPRVGNPHGDMDLDCKLCHAGGTWELTHDSGFDHDATGYPLKGMHRFALCRDCHREPVFAHIGTHCADCHSDAHRGRLGPSCADCHTPEAWVDLPQARRDHNATALPLVGAHERVDCDACHTGAVSGDYVGTPTDCYACHADVYAQATAPDHVAANFGTNCERCHGVFSSTWGAGDFIHDQIFPLTGEHRRIDCTECHSDGFADTPRECVACHQIEYDDTTDPAHVEAGFPTDCAVCHDTNAWVPGRYDHNATAFPLTGAHRGPACVACHETGYTGTPTDCVACHQMEYDNTNDPSHVASGFPVSCEDCHTTSAWEPANWDHDVLFPIYSGKHREAWNSCTECHVVQTDYSIFECIECHEHNQTDTDNDHDPQEVPDYEYSSAACFECHPRGENN